MNVLGGYSFVINEVGFVVRDVCRWWYGLIRVGCFCSESSHAVSLRGFQCSTRTVPKSLRSPETCPLIRVYVESIVERYYGPGGAAEKALAAHPEYIKGAGTTKLDVYFSSIRLSTCEKIMSFEFVSRGTVAQVHSLVE